VIPIDAVAVLRKAPIGRAVSLSILTMLVLVAPIEAKADPALAGTWIVGAFQRAARSPAAWLSPGGDVRWRSITRSNWLRRDGTNLNPSG
jgi:hypothetical protein